MLSVMSVFYSKKKYLCNYWLQNKCLDARIEVVADYAVKQVKSIIAIASAGKKRASALLYFAHIQGCINGGQDRSFQISYHSLDGKYILIDIIS